MKDFNYIITSMAMGELEPPKRSQTINGVSLTTQAEGTRAKRHGKPVALKRRRY